MPWKSTGGTLEHGDGLEKTCGHEICSRSFFCDFAMDYIVCVNLSNLLWLEMLFKKLGICSFW